MVNRGVFVDVDITGTLGSRSYVYIIDRIESNVSPMTSGMSHPAPIEIDAGQAYYWRYSWQVGEQESRRELAEGHGRTFPNAQEAIRWLLSSED